MEIIIRIGAGLAVALLLVAAGCSAILSGATDDALGVVGAASIDLAR